MTRSSSSAVGALHPVLFLLTVYVISFVLAFFVCRMIYFGLHQNNASAQIDLTKTEAVTMLK